MATSKSTQSKNKNKLLLNFFFFIIGGIAIFLLLLSFFNLFFEKSNEDEAQFFINNDTTSTFKVVSLTQDHDIGTIYLTNKMTIEPGNTEKFYQNGLDHLRCVILEQQTGEDLKPIFHLNIDALNTNQETDSNVIQFTYKISELTEVFSNVDNNLCFFYINNIDKSPGKGKDSSVSDEQWLKVRNFFK